MANAFRSISTPGINAGAKALEQMAVHSHAMREQVIPTLRDMQRRLDALEAEVRRLKGEPESPEPVD